MEDLTLFPFDAHAFFDGIYRMSVDTNGEVMNHEDLFYGLSRKEAREPLLFTTFPGSGTFFTCLAPLRVL